jgi:hypothetical protein
MGEGGGAPLSTLCSAIQDVLGAGRGVVVDTHNTSEDVWRLLRAGADRPIRVTSR